MDLRVLTWNVFGGRAASGAGGGGRAASGAGRDLPADHAAALAGWEWDVALLQQAPPTWLAQLRESLQCEASGVLASRTTLLPLRRALGVRTHVPIRPADGGASLILARSDRIVHTRAAQVSRWPDRRRVHGVALACGVWVATVHTGAGDAAARDLREAARAASEWARRDRLPLILGADLGGPAASAAEPLRTAAADGADHVLCSEGVEIRAPSVATLEPGTLSGRAPLAVTLVI